MRPTILMFIAYIQASCVDFRTDGWMNHSSGTSVFQSGLPPPGALTFVKLPASMNVCDLEYLDQTCVNRINAYRAGLLNFSNGQKDPGTRGNLTDYTQNVRCANAMAYGDFYVNNNSGSLCAGAHTNINSTYPILNKLAVRVRYDLIIKSSMEY